MRSAVSITTRSGYPFCGGRTRKWILGTSRTRNSPPSPTWSSTWRPSSTSTSAKSRRRRDFAEVDVLEGRQVEDHVGLGGEFLVLEVPKIHFRVRPPQNGYPLLVVIDTADLMPLCVEVIGKRSAECPRDAGDEYLHG